MDTGNKVILVTGATGKQGGAVACSLLGDGWKVRALTRNPDKPASRMLKNSGAEVVRGSLDDRDSINHALKGVYGVYSVQNFGEHGVDKEILQGKLLADAAKAAGVSHFVYSSVSSANRRTGIPHFDSKWEVEKYIQKLGLPATVIRPTFFMENFIATPDWQNQIFEGRLSMALKPKTRLQMIAVDDIGAFVALAFMNPDEYIGTSLDIAGDELTGPEIAGVFGSAIGKTVKFEELPIEEVRKFSEEYAIMYEWFNKTGYNVDIDALRSIYPDLKTFQRWVSEKTWTKVGV